MVHVDMMNADIPRSKSRLMALHVCNFYGFYAYVILRWLHHKVLAL